METDSGARSERPLNFVGLQPFTLVQPLVLLVIGLGLPLIVLGTES